MKFTKMHGAGNDFIIINNIEEKLPLSVMPKIAKCLCARRTSIGADGFMVVEKPHADGDFYMHFYNSDGSIGEMCGNGARCIARFGYANGLSGGRNELKIETDCGLVIGTKVDERMYRVRLNDPTTIRLNITVELDGKSIPCSYVELGNPGLPHAVVPYSGLADANEDELRELGRKIRWYKEFPKGANVNFCEVIGENHILVKTFERGVEDFTLACGTGSGSTAAVLALTNEVSHKNIRLSMAGGDLYVDVNIENNFAKDLYLTGPTNFVAIGEVLDEDLKY